MFWLVLIVGVGALLYLLKDKFMLKVINFEVSEGEEQVLKCPDQHFIEIKSAKYGKDDAKFPHDPDCPDSDVKDKLSASVNGRNSFGFTSFSHFLNSIVGSKCDGVHKRLKGSFVCKRART